MPLLFLFPTWLGPQHGSRLAMVVGATVAAFLVLMIVLHGMPPRGKRVLIGVSTFLAGLFYMLEFFLPAAHPRVSPDNFLSPYVEPATHSLAIIAGLALATGIVNLVRVNGRLLLSMRPGWYNGLAFFIGLISMSVFGLWHFYRPDSISVSGIYDLLFLGLYQNLGSSVFALLAFYITSAAFRAFRVRTPEATILLGTACIVMLGLMPAAQLWLTGAIPKGRFYSGLRVEEAGNWVMTTVNMSARRAMNFGVALGALAMALRVWLSLERGRFFDQEF